MSSARFESFCIWIYITSLSAFMTCFQRMEIKPSSILLFADKQTRKVDFSHSSSVQSFLHTICIICRILCGSSPRNHLTQDEDMILALQQLFQTSPVTSFSALNVCSECFSELGLVLCTASPSSSLVQGSGSTSRPASANSAPMTVPYS